MFALVIFSAFPGERVALERERVEGAVAVAEVLDDPQSFTAGHVLGENTHGSAKFSIRPDELRFLNPTAFLLDGLQSAQVFFDSVDDQFFDFFVFLELRPSVRAECFKTI